MVPVEWGLGARSLGDSPGEVLKRGALLFHLALAAAGPAPLGPPFGPGSHEALSTAPGQGGACWGCPSPAGAVHRLLGLSITLAQADRVRRGWRLPGKAMRLGPWVDGESTASHTSQKFN